MNRQKIFNKVYRHLLKQNQKSMNEIEGDVTCAYRGADGLKCAIGCLIPNRLYSGDSELKGVNALSEEIRDHLGVESVADLNFLDALQTIHDNTEVICWDPSLKRFAEAYGLSIPKRVG